MESIRGKWQPRAELILKKIVKDYAVTPTPQDLTGLSKQPIKDLWREYFRLGKEIEERAIASEVAIQFGESVQQIAQEIANDLSSFISHYKVALYLKKHSTVELDL
jgi:hypothetical protein